MTKRPPPRYYGVRTYRDPKGRFSFHYPNTWHEFELSDDREGVLVSPENEDPQTWFSVWVSRLDINVVAEDLEDLRVGVDEGLAALPECQIETASEESLGNLVKFERIFTFQESGVTRKRKMWMLYVDTWLMVVTYQGANEEEYAYWLPMGNYAFFRFDIPEALWFATDRDLTGLLRFDSVQQPDQAQDMPAPEGAHD
jgi:hypothetical protein